MILLFKETGFTLWLLYELILTTPHLFYNKMAPIRHHTVNRLFSLFDKNRLKSLNMCTSYLLQSSRLLAAARDALKHFNGTIPNRMHCIIKEHLIINLFSKQ